MYVTKKAFWDVYQQNTKTTLKRKQIDMKSTQHVHPKIDQKNKQVTPEVHETVKAVFLTDCELVANESGKGHEIKKKLKA